MNSFENIAIAVLLALQIFIFIKVWRKIKSFKNFFPNSFHNISIAKFSVNRSVLEDNIAFSKFISKIGQEQEHPNEDNGDQEQVELLVLPKGIQITNNNFAEVIRSTNAYLCKNKGSSADFNILKDICERHIQKHDNSVGNLINVPLYIGLAGTFLGIIIGLRGIEFNNDVSSLATKSIDRLLNGIVLAMIASLVGLAFTVINSAFNYKPAAYKNDTDKNSYYDFLQRELLPVLNVGMAGSLTSFRGILNHFILKFGENIEEYKDSAELLNENLHRQQAVLEEINKLSLTKTSAKIADVFVKLNESSEHLASFREYQKGLNENMQTASKTLSELNVTALQFKDFNSNLKVLANGVQISFELQKQLKESLEKHFPVIQDHRIVWRKQVDELNTDIKEVYKQLNEYFARSTEHIQTFVQNNHNFFTGVDQIQNSIQLFVSNSTATKETHKSLHDEIRELRNDLRETQLASLDLNKELVAALKDIALQIRKSEISNPLEK